jgi:predicted nucleic acid-binding protein
LLRQKKHWNIFSKLVKDEKAVGDLIMEAHLVALAIENNAAIVSNDRDLLRFSEYVKIINPLKS